MEQGYGEGPDVGQSHSHVVLELGFGLGLTTGSVGVAGRVGGNVRVWISVWVRLVFGFI